MTADAPLIFLVAGEPSGDALGGRLMAALKRRTAGKVRFAGVVKADNSRSDGYDDLSFPADDPALGIR